MFLVISLVYYYNFASITLFIILKILKITLYNLIYAKNFIVTSELRFLLGPKNLILLKIKAAKI